MPLKSQLFDRQGRVIEQMAFAELTLRDRVPDRDVSLTIPPALNGLTKCVAVQSVRMSWAGVSPTCRSFKLKVTRLQPVMGSSVPVRHGVFRWFGHGVDVHRKGGSRRR
jgi:negative regulator of sigma E activity